MRPPLPLASLFLFLLLPLSLDAQTAPPDPEESPAQPPVADPEPAMTLDRLDEILRALDPEAQGDGRVWRIDIDGVQVLIVTDETADRMRAITPVARTEDMTPEDNARVLQANFDSALDARYAVAKGVLWSAFIHPLRALEKDQLISGIGQVVNLARTYGTLYTGGALQYGGGDSGALQRALIDELLKKGQDI